MPSPNFNNSNAQRDARQLYLRQKAQATEAASKQTAISSGPPVAMDEVVVTAQRPTFSEIQKDTRDSEVDFVKREAANAIKSTAANLAGLPADLFNLLNPQRFTGVSDFDKGTSAHVKKLIGVDPGSLGDVAGDVNPFDPLSKVGAAAGVVKAGLLVPIGLWHNTAEADEAAQLIEETVSLTGMRDMPIGDQWLELNRSLFEKTGGWMLDFNGNIRRWFAPKEGGLNPNIILPDGKISVRQDAKLEDVLAPEVWHSFDQASIDHLKKIPVRWIIDANGEWSDRKGIGLFMAQLYRDPQKFLATLHHELGHGFDAMAGSGKGGSVEVSLGRKVAIEKQDVAFDKMQQVAERSGNAANATLIKMSVLSQSRAKHFGGTPTKDAEKVIDLGRKILGDDIVDNYVRASDEFFSVYKVDYDNYLKISGEVLARAVGRHQNQGTFPLDDLDVSISDISQMPNRTPTGLTSLPQRQPDSSIMVGDVVTQLVYKSEDPRKLEAEIQAGKWDNEIQRLIQAQRADATRDKSKFANPTLNAEYEEARRRLGVGDPVRQERPERINESFPATSDRPTLMRPRNTQGARLDDSRGGPPTKYEGFGHMMENAELLATGREEVWKSGSFDVNAFNNKVARLDRQRAVTAAKGSTSQATNKVKLEPKFWAFDPEVGKIAVVTAKQGGGYDIKYKTGKITDAVMDKVDIVATRKGLNEFISKTMWKKRTGEPIQYLDPNN